MWEEVLGCEETWLKAAAKRHRRQDKPTPSKALRDGFPLWIFEEVSPPSTFVWSALCDYPDCVFSHCQAVERCMYSLVGEGDLCKST